MEGGMLHATEGGCDINIIVIVIALTGGLGIEGLCVLACLKSKVRLLGDSVRQFPPSPIDRENRKRDARGTR